MNKKGKKRQFPQRNRISLRYGIASAIANNCLNIPLVAFDKASTGNDRNT